jgi:DNA-binding NarL/FixJ family response regulator
MSRQERFATLGHPAAAFCHSPVAVDPVPDLTGVFCGIQADPPAALADLTPREREVLDLLARGLSNPQICDRLVISEATAKTHVARILQKLGLRDRIQTVIYAYEMGIITRGQAYRADGGLPRNS